MDQILEKINEFSESELESLKEFKARGGKAAALLNRNFPSSLLWGLGVRPVRILTGATGEAEKAGEKLVRPDVCPFCKSIIGNFLEKKSLHALCNMVVGSISCDMMRRTLERLSSDIGLPLFPVQVPATTTKESLEYYTRGVRNTIDNISAWLDADIDYDKVRTFERNRIEAAGILIKLLYSGKTSPLINHHLSHLFTWSQPDTYLQFLKELIPQIPAYKTDYNIVITGSVLLLEDDTILRLVADNNFGVVPLNSSGLNMVEGLEDISDVPDDKIIAGLSRIAFRMPGNIRIRPNNEVYDRLLEVIERTDAKGVIVKTLSFCDLWYTEKERLKQVLPVPVLVLDTGYAEGADAQVQTRIETFLETLR